MKKEDIIKIIQAGGTCSHMNLSGMDLSHSNLSGADFRGSNLECADLSFSNISGTCFQECNCKRGNFQHTVVAGATKIIANLGGLPISNLSHPNFRSSDLSGADFSFSRVEKGDFVDADLRKSIWDNGFFRECEFGRSTMECISLNNVDVQSCDFTGASLKMLQMLKGCFYKCVFITADLTEAEISHSEIEKCKFDEAVMVSVTLHNDRVSNSTFLSMYAPEMFVTESSFTDVSFEMTNLDKSKWQECEFTETTFRGANLPGAIFDETCHGLNLQGAVGFQLRTE